jgi:tetratricopeptide (TPR) repeat protein
VKGHGQKETLVEIKADVDNVRLAWRGAVADRDAEAIERSAECLFVFYLYSSGHYEGQTAFQQAAAAFIEDASPSTANDLPDELVALDKQENLVGFLLAGQGYFLARTLDPQAGQALLEQALALLRRAEQAGHRKEAFALLWLGWALFYYGSLPEAMSYAEQSLPLFAEMADSWGEGWSLLLWGICVAYIRPTEADEVYKRALTTCRKSGDQSVLGYVSHNLCFVMTVLGQYLQAQQFIDEATRIFEELDNKLGLGYVCHRRAELAIPQGQYWQAIQTLEQGIAYFNELKNPVSIAYCQIWIAKAFRLQGDYSRAEQLYLQTLAELTAMNHQLFIAFCLTELGCLAYDRGELPRAEQFHQEALAAWQQIEQDVGVAATLGHLGQVLAVSGEHRHAEARHYFRQALELATELQVAPIALEVCVGVAQLLAQTEEIEQAVELLALVEQHETSTFETKKKARQSLAELVDRLLPETAQAAQARGQTRDVWGATQDLLVEFLSTY